MPAQPTQESAPPLESNRTFKCPACTYAASRASILSRHMNKFHPADTGKAKHQLVKILDASDSVPEMLTAVADWLKDDAGFTGYLPPEVIIRLKKEDARINIALKLIAIAKIQRVLDQSSLLQDLDQKQSLLIRNKEKPLTSEELSRLVSRTQDSIKQDLELVKELLAVGHIDLGDIVNSLTDLFTGQPFVQGVTKPNAFTIPTDANSRERVRTIALQILVKDGDGSTAAAPRAIGPGEKSLGPIAP